MTLPLLLTRSQDIVWAVAPERPYRPASILEQIGNTPLLDLSFLVRKPDRYFYVDQYNNDSNWRAHYDGTVPEILCQTDSRVTHFGAGLGTTGAFMGVGRRLKEANSAIQLVALQPADEVQVIEGLKHLETSSVPGIYDANLADRTLDIEAADALDMTRRLAREAGLFVGFSAGTAAHGALQVANELDSGVVVTILPDGGAKYLSLGLFE